MNGLKTDTIINRDALYALRELPEESVHCCVTSPPYYALRDYEMCIRDSPNSYINRCNVACLGQLNGSSFFPTRN